MHTGEGDPCRVHKALFIPAAPGGEGANHAGEGEHLESLHGSQALQKATAFLKFPRGVGNLPFPPHNPIRQPICFLPTSGLPSSQQAPPSSLVKLSTATSIEAEGQKGSKKGGSKNQKREGGSAMPGVVGGEKEGTRIAPAVAGGELQRQLAKVGQKTLVSIQKQRLVLFELCSRPQAKG